MLICTKTGRVLSPGESLRVLTPLGFTEAVLDGLTGAVRVRGGDGIHEVAFDDIEAVRRLTGHARHAPMMSATAGLQL
jgi:hypothetical protein